MNEQKTYQIIARPDGSNWVQIAPGQEVEILSQIPPGIRSGNFLLGRYNNITYALNYEPFNNRRPHNNKKRRGDCTAPSGATQTDSRPPDQHLNPNTEYFAIYCDDTGNPGELLKISDNTLSALQNKYKPQGIKAWNYFSMDQRPATNGEITENMVIDVLDDVWS